jgi:hypothetical protein
MYQTSIHLNLTITQNVAMGEAEVTTGGNASFADDNFFGDPMEIDSAPASQATLTATSTLTDYPLTLKTYEDRNMPHPHHNGDTLYESLVKFYHTFKLGDGALYTYKYGTGISSLQRGSRREFVYEGTENVVKLKLTGEVKAKAFGTALGLQGTQKAVCAFKFSLFPFLCSPYKLEFEL